MQTIAIRCEATADIGYGHLTRMLALAIALRAQAQSRQLEVAIQFLMSNASQSAFPLIVKAGFAVDEPALTADPVNLLIVDHYGTSGAELRTLRTTAHRLLLIDDMQPERVSEAVDGLLNPNFGWETLAYPPFAGQRRWMGPQYALLRQQFQLVAQSPQPFVQHCRRLLVSFGGADPSDMTLKILSVLGTLDSDTNVAVTVVIGAAYRSRPALYEFATRQIAMQMTILEHVEEMAVLMRAHDLLIAPASTLALEAAAVGVPCAYAITVDNQVLSGEALQRQEVAWNLYDYRNPTEDSQIADRLQMIMEDNELRRRLAENGPRSVRADGATVVAEHIFQHWLSGEEH
jgi:UDP-2,4-diacetamido-2,4,6-trideoxy-beta-L-altropyranose hydrolase